MKNIGIFHYQVGRTDGVSLEIDKWKRVLEEMGHTVHLCAGDLGAAEGTLIEEMYHHRAAAERLNYNTFRELRDRPSRRNGVPGRVDGPHWRHQAQNAPLCDREK